MTQTNLQKYNSIFTSVFDVPETALNADFNFATAEGWDSLAHMELIAQIEDEFGIMFDADDITHFAGYENGKKILERYGIEI